MVTYIRIECYQSITSPLKVGGLERNLRLELSTWKPSTQLPSEQNWYTRKNGIIKGPNNLQEILAQEEFSTTNPTIHYSRQGLTRWYTGHELKRFLTLNGDLTKEIEQLEDVWQKSLEHLKSLAKDPSHDSKKVIVADEAADQQTESNKGLDEDKDNSTNPILPNKKFHFELDKIYSSTSHHFFKGRLKLGRHQHPFVVGILYPLMTLGLYWYLWLKDRFLEVLYHKDHHYFYQKIVPFFWPALIPGVHLIYTYVLASMVRKMEEQNGYGRTSPLMALFLGLCPPLAIIYLQAGINHHWHLHIQHVTKRLST